ncbi:MAG: hypothetical protein P8123_07685, partial [bacterium]
MGKLLWLAPLLSAALMLTGVAQNKLSADPSGAAKSVPEEAQGGMEKHPIMRPDRETFQKWVESYKNAPRTQIDPYLMERKLGAYSVL